MGDRRKQALHVQFDGTLKLEFHGTKVTSDAGLLAFRELGVYGRLAGYEAVNDADRLRVDPAMLRVVGGRAKETVRSDSSGAAIITVVTC